jgi:hypothetical protein
MNPVVHCLAGPLLAAWSNCLDGLQQRLDHHVEVLESKEHPYIYVTAVGVIVGEVVHAFSKSHAYDRCTCKRAT